MANQQRATEAERPGRFAWGDWKAVGSRVKTDVGSDNLSVVAAGVAFYAFFSLIPTLTALVSIYGMVADPSDVQRLVDSMRGWVPGDVAEIISNQLGQLAGGSASQLGVGAAVALLVALWSATKGTKSLMSALNIAYGESETRGFLRLNATALLLTFGAIIGVVVSVALVIAAPALLDRIGLPGTAQVAIDWLRWPFLALVVSVGLAVLYRFGPSRAPAKWRWLNYGAVVATLLWLAASGLFSLYVSNFGSYNETFGAVAGIAILLMWFFISAFVVLLGAELNSEMEHHRTSSDSTAGGARPMGQRGAAVADSGPDDRERFKA